MAYIYPEMKSKIAYKRALASGETFTVRENTPWGQKPVKEGTVGFENPHYPKPHTSYGQVTVKDGKVIKVV